MMSFNSEQFADRRLAFIEWCKSENLPVTGDGVSEFDSIIELKSPAWRAWNAALDLMERKG